MSAWMVAAYAVLGSMLLVRLWQRGRRTWDARLTHHDRALVSATANIFGVPACVALAWGVQCGLLARWHLPAEQPVFAFFWSSLGPAERLPAFGSGWAAALVAGPLVLLACAALLLASVPLLPMRAALNLLRLATGRTLLMFGLGLWPAASLLLRRGDTWALRNSLRQMHPWLGDALPLGLLLLASGGWLVWQRWLRQPLGAYAQPEHDRLQRLRKRLAAQPQDGTAQRDLAKGLLGLGQGAAALQALPEPDAIVRMTDGEAPALLRAELSFLRGIAHLQQGQTHAAIKPLCHAGQLLESGAALPPPQAQLLLETVLALAAARLGVGDSEGALQTCEAGLALRPGEPRLSLVYADALVRAGRPEEARSSLQRGLRRANASLTQEIEQRLRALGAPANPR